MKKNKGFDFFSTICLSMIFCGMLCVASRVFTRILVKKNVCPPFLSRIVFFDREDLRGNADLPKKGETLDISSRINWKELYPFEGDEAEKAELDNLQNRQTFEIKLNLALVEEIKRGINSWFGEKFCIRNFWIESSKMIERFLVGNIVSLNTGGFITVGNDEEYISSVSPKTDVLQQAKSLIALNDFLKQNGIPFLYVQAPFKISPLDDEAGTIDFTNQNADEFLKILKENNVEFIDMREKILETGRDFHSFFYKTDHHWKAETGLFACPIIAEKVNEIANTEIDTVFFNPQNFDFEVFKDSFLGSCGRTLTLALAKMEDITLITPKKDFDLQTEIYSSNAQIRKESGGFETFIFKEHLSTEETALTKNAYCIYMSGDTVEFIKNNSCENDYRVLFLGDSFTDVVEPFFALSVSNFDSLDLRVFKGSFKNYVKQNKPYNVCVCIYNPSAFADENLWNFE